MWTCHQNPHFSKFHPNTLYIKIFTIFGRLLCGLVPKLVSYFYAPMWLAKCSIAEHANFCLPVMYPIVVNYGSNSAAQSQSQFGPELHFTSKHNSWKKTFRSSSQTWGCHTTIRLKWWHYKSDVTTCTTPYMTAHIHTRRFVSCGLPGKKRKFPDYKRRKRGTVDFR